MKKFSQPRRPLAAAATLAVVLAAGLTACGSSGGSTEYSEEDPAALTFSWWGSDPRHEANQAIMTSFGETHPAITVEGQFGDWNGYWDRLATTTAGGDAADIITMDEQYLQEYAGRGALADLSSLAGLDLSKFDESTINSGKYEDGLYGLSTGRNVYVVMANQDLFEQAGVALPDDSIWTWEDYYRISEELRTKLDGVSGTDYGALDVDLNIWLRQQGESLYNQDGEGVGYGTANAASWFEHLLKVRDEGGGSTAAQAVEDQAGTLESASFPNNRAAMDWYWSNQLGALENASGSNITMLRAPSSTGEAKDNGMFFKASMYWSVSSGSDYQEAAAEFVNYLANNKEAAEKLLLDRGVPVNPDMRAAIEPQLEKSESEVMSFLEGVEPDMETSPRPAPVGASGVQLLVNRYASEVLFGTLTPEQAAEQMTGEIESLIG
ncbi:multiple sugar transport system substrate-binding protein [Arthrobacter sp. UYP6]|uniref:ABC transporter substrate-binding protein n=1 Tax=Arthrobacter sp. UYP6 TaxID=1756378 RepID=UPI003390C63C